jgi:hypothetical protein
LVAGGGVLGAFSADVSGTTGIAPLLDAAGLEIGGATGVWVKG